MILLADPPTARWVGLLGSGPVTVTPPEPEALKPWLPAALALIVRNLAVTEALLDQGPSLRVVGRLGSGLDNIDVAACAARRVTVIHAPGANADSVGDATLAALLIIARRWDEVLARTARGDWIRPVAGHELSGRRLLVVGFGHVGRAVARRAEGFGLSIVVHDPRLARSGASVPESVEEAPSLIAAIPRADFVSLHLPLTPETRHLIGPQALAAFRPDAWLINTSRGGLVDEGALAAALRGQRLAGAYLDVREEEPPPVPDPLASMPNVLRTPHVAGLSLDAQARIARHVFLRVAAALNREPRPVPSLPL